MLPLLPLLALACVPVPSPAEDQAAYLSNNCDRIVDPRLGDECRMFVVRHDPFQAESLCPQQVQPYMRDECWFVRVDAAQLLGEDARRGCQRAGRYAGPCISNALSREITRIKEQHPDDCLALTRQVLLDYHRPDVEAQAIRLCR